jgi:hypothetical protein
MAGDEKKPPVPAGERSAAALEGIRLEARRIADALERLSPPPAPRVDLDDAKGNPVVRFDPRDWKGPSFKGKPFSLCPADYLEALAAAFDSMGANADDARERHFKRLDAARARGWAERVRTGWKPRKLGAPAPTSSSTSKPAPGPATAPRGPISGPRPEDDGRDPDGSDPSEDDDLSVD